MKKSKFLFGITALLASMVMMGCDMELRDEDDRISSKDYDSQGYHINGTYKVSVGSDDETHSTGAFDNIDGSKGLTIAFKISAIKSDQVIFLKNDTIELRGYYGPWDTYATNGGTASSGSGKGDHSAIKVDTNNNFLIQVYNVDGTIQWYLNGSLLYGWEATEGGTKKAAEICSCVINSAISNGFKILTHTEEADMEMSDLIYMDAIDEISAKALYTIWKSSN